MGRHPATAAGFGRDPGPFRKGGDAMAYVPLAAV